MDDTPHDAGMPGADKGCARPQFIAAEPSAGGLVSRASVTDERRAVRFFWSVLILATCASVAGNVTHAVWNASDAAVIVAALAALVPPLVLLGATHSVGVLARVRASAGFTYWATMTITMTLALCAFVLSFDALRSVAVDLAGFKPDIAWLWPLCIDLSITGSTLALLSFSLHRATTAPQASGTPTKQPNGSPPRSGPERLVSVSTDRRAHGHGMSPIQAADTPKAVEGPTNNGDGLSASVALLAIGNGHDPAGGASDVADWARWGHVADRLVHEGRTKIEAPLVARVLALTETQTPPSTIARLVGVHHSAVRRILAAAPNISGSGGRPGAVPGVAE